MKNKIMTMIGTAALVFTMGTTAFAASSSEVKTSAQGNTQDQTGNYSCIGRNGSGYGLMMNEDGEFLSKSEFETKLNDAVKDGTIKAEDKDTYKQMYDYCVSGNGSGYGKMMRPSAGSTGRGGCCR